MVHHHVARARLARTGPGSDEPVDRHRGLDLLGLEELVEQVRHGHREQARHVADLLDVEPPEAQDQPQPIEQVARPLRAEVRWGRHQDRAENLGDRAHPRIPLLEVVRVALVDRGELLVVLLRVVVLDHHAAVGQRDDIRPDRMDAVPVPLHLEVLEDRVGHQAHDVAERRDLHVRQVGPGRAGVGGAAGLLTRLAQDDASPRLREVRGGDQPVVTAPDDDGVVGVRHLEPPLAGCPVSKHGTERPFKSGARPLR